MLHVALLAASIVLQDLPRQTLPATLRTPAERALAAQRRLFDDWAAAWRSSETARAIQFGEINPHSSRPPYNARMADVSCYFGWDDDLTYVPDGAWGLVPMHRKIASKTNQHHWVCPNWMPPENYFIPSAHPPDERVAIDNALEPGLRPRIAAQRRAAIAQMANALKLDPRDSVLAGQLVRMLVDDGNLIHALDAATNCVADRAWCLALTGFVHHRRGEIKAADDAFAKSMAALGDAERCAWTDIAPLLDGSARTMYTPLSCTRRDSLADVVWWLADPLWTVDGNDRRTEQFARRVTVLLHAATGRDERFNWLPAAGGDALAEMVMRYGWPSYTFGMLGGMPINFGPPKPPSYGYVLLYKPKPTGPPIATDHTRARALGGIKTTYEYTIGRLHMIPQRSMIADPFSIQNTDWSLNAPGGDGDATLKWWPQEHYAPLHPLIGIMDQQTAFLRRERETLLAYATNLGQTDLTRRLGDSVTGKLAVSTGPASVNVVASHRTGAHDRLTFLAPLPQGPSLVSAEIPWDSAGRRAARARFSVAPPPPLSALAPGALAISQPVVLVVPPGTVALPLLADSAVLLMRGSTTLSANTNAIGVYWETYGFTATDSVEVTVSVQRHSGNILSRIGAGAGVTADANALVTTKWREPQRGYPARTIAGRVPVQMRSVVVDIGTLTPGEYTLEITVSKRGSDPVKGVREFVLR